MGEECDLGFEWMGDEFESGWKLQGLEGKSMEE